MLASLCQRRLVARSVSRHMTQIHAILKITTVTLEIYAANKKAYTYLNSVRHLYRFLTCEGLCTNEQAKIIGQMKDHLACWISSYRCV